MWRTLKLTGTCGKNWDKMVRVPNIEEMRIQHTFGIWPLELLRIQRFSYTSDEIPPLGVIISDCNTESWWQKHYSYAFLLQRSQIAFRPELYFLFLMIRFLYSSPFPEGPLWHFFFLFLYFSIIFQKPETAPSSCLLRISRKVYAFCW